jgi:hypothetical protein
MAALLAVLLALGALTGQGAAPDVREVLRNAFANVQKNNKVADQYNYKERQVVRHLNSNGAVTKTEIRTYDVIQIEGTPWRRLVAKDDQPLPPGEERKEQQRIDKETRQRAGETPAERQKRIQKHEKQRQEQEEIDREVLDAFSFRLAGRESVAGVACLVIEGTPKPDYRPRKKETALLKHLGGRLWISEDSNEFVKMEANVLEDISFGWFLAKLKKGGRIALEQTRVNEEVWLPHSLSLRLGARALIKQINLEAQVSYFDYKKFRVESKITGTAEEKPR